MAVYWLGVMVMLLASGAMLGLRFGGFWSNAMLGTWLVCAAVWAIGWAVTVWGFARWWREIR